MPGQVSLQLLENNMIVFKALHYNSLGLVIAFLNFHKITTPNPHWNLYKNDTSQVICKWLQCDECLVFAMNYCHSQGIALQFVRKTHFLSKQCQQILRNRMLPSFWPTTLSGNRTWFVIILRHMQYSNNMFGIQLSWDIMHWLFLYSHALSKFLALVQKFDMESNWKRVLAAGRK